MGNQEWMTSLDERCRNTPIINLAIPGSHNSMMYGITRKTAPDADPVIRRLNYFFPFFVKRWAKTQSATVLEQLELGVRFFDLRISQRDNTFYYVHALFAMEVFEPLYQLKEFLLKHPYEVIVLDLQHFYSMSLTHHLELQQRLLALFGPMLYSQADGDLFNCTLNYCARLRKQIILIYRRCPVSLPSEFWPSNSWPTPWPNVASMKKLEDFLQDSLKNRLSTQGYVSQCVLTPNGRYITLRFYSSLRKTAKRVDKKLKSWIIDQNPGTFIDNDKPRVNVFLADYINLKDGQFCNWVIGLNMKLVQNKENDNFEGFGYALNEV